MRRSVKLGFHKLHSSRHGWCLYKGKGSTTTIPPEGIKVTRNVWSGKIKTHDLQAQLLIRNVILNAMGKLSKATAALAASLKYPHHQGA